MIKHDKALRLSMCCVTVRARCLVPHRLRRPPHRSLLPASSLFAPLPPSPDFKLLRVLEVVSLGEITAVAGAHWYE